MLSEVHVPVHVPLVPMDPRAAPNHPKGLNAFWSTHLDVAEAMVVSKLCRNLQDGGEGEVRPLFDPS